MLLTAIVLFVIGAIFGLIILSSFLRNGATPKGAVVLHGLLVVVGLILVIAYVAGNPPGPSVAMILFIITAAGGLILLAIDLSKKPLSRFLAFLHPILAVISLIVLVIWYFGNGRGAA